MIKLTTPHLQKGQMTYLGYLPNKLRQKIELYYATVSWGYLQQKMQRVLQQTHPNEQSDSSVEVLYVNENQEILPLSIQQTPRSRIRGDLGRKLVVVDAWLAHWRTQLQQHVYYEMKNGQIENIIMRRITATIQMLEPFEKYRSLKFICKQMSLQELLLFSQMDLSYQQQLVSKVRVINKNYKRAFPNITLRLDFQKIIKEIAKKTQKRTQNDDLPVLVQLNQSIWAQIELFIEKIYQSLKKALRRNEVSFLTTRNYQILRIYEDDQHFLEDEPNDARAHPPFLRFIEYDSVGEEDFYPQEQFRQICMGYPQIAKRIPNQQGQIHQF